MTQFAELVFRPGARLTCESYARTQVVATTVAAGCRSGMGAEKYKLYYLCIYIYIYDYLNQIRFP